jgi:hypothetical protein
MASAATPLQRLKDECMSSLGKPIERWGRKVTGLPVGIRPIHGSRTARLAFASVLSWASPLIPAERP